MIESSAPDFDRLGDDLEAAAARSVAASRRRSRARLVGIAVVGLSLLAAGTAVAAGVFSPRQVAAGLPAGSVIFGNTHPTCVLDADAVTFHCTLDVAPQSDEMGVPPAARPGSPSKATGVPGTPDYSDWKEPIGIDGVVAGGCVARSSDGLRWDCYVGDEAVRQLIISQDFLGQPMTEPGRG